MEKKRVKHIAPSTKVFCYDYMFLSSEHFPFVEKTLGSSRTFPHICRTLVLLVVKVPPYTALYE